jgi:hypothetical protein
MRLLTPGMVTVTVGTLSIAVLMTILNVRAFRTTEDAYIDTTAEYDYQSRKTVRVVEDNVDDGAEMTIELPWDVVEGLNVLSEERSASGI